MQLPEAAFLVDEADGCYHGSKFEFKAPPLDPQRVSGRVPAM
jgi:hypothetical protein